MLPSNKSLVEQLRWKKFHVLSGGFVALVDVMGDDNAVVQAARTSYGRDGFGENRELLNAKLEKLYPKGGVSKYIGPDGKAAYSLGQIEEASKACREDDIKLIRYLMQHRHTTPFEMAEIKLVIQVPMDCWRQWIRHRTASVNEYSTRYTTAIDLRDTTQPDQWRYQSKSNKQGSSNFIPESDGIILSSDEAALHRHATEVYEKRLKAGVANEQARKDLPLSTYTRAYWKCDLHNTLHFLGLRMDPHAQKEIRDYANVIGNEIIKPLFPVTWQAFEDYRLNSLTLSGLEVEAMNTGVKPDSLTEREYEEFKAKMKRIAINLA